MDEREEMKRLVAIVIQNAAQEDSKLLRADVDLFLSAGQQLVGIMSSRYDTLAKKRRPNRPKPPKSAPATPLQQHSSPKSSADTPKSKMDAQGAGNRPEGKSHIRRGIQQAQRAPKSKQQALLRQVYGSQNKKVAFQKAAKELAS